MTMTEECHFDAAPGRENDASFPMAYTDRIFYLNVLRQLVIITAHFSCLCSGYVKFLHGFGSSDSFLKKRIRIRTKLYGFLT
jgi:hypothetical protein